MLLTKLISFDTMQMDEADENDNELKEKLYKLFFNWGDMFLKGDAKGAEEQNSKMEEGD